MTLVGWRRLTQLSSLFPMAEGHPVPLALQDFGLQTQPIRTASEEKVLHVSLQTSTEFVRRTTELDPQRALN